ncbi:MAG TPA: hypothetical protein VNB59_00695 [Solirubrobacterales bacterium]|nr:hypothetical protein [Solirubrobacterales bacterium]
MSSPLSPLPDQFAAAVSSLHRVAEEVVAPARKPDNEIALEATPGGFGTPRFEWEGATHQVRVEGAELVRETDRRQRREPLDVDSEAARVLAEWYELGREVLERLRSEASAAEAASEPILWPEHFDLAIELGSDAAGARATYGFSPGDENHSEPYVYVGPWIAQPAGDLWNAHGFAGAELGYAELLASGDPEAAAIDFIRSRRDALADGKPTEESQ